MNLRFCFRSIICALLVIADHGLQGQVAGSKTGTVYVDEKGLLRWGNHSEVKGFGVNYTAPFAHAYRSAKKLNVDLKQAIDNDVYHFSRLGFDAYRVHVWDTEISDTTGNLIVNEHLELFDYMLMKMKERGMKFLLTPIAFWGNGYPDPDEKTPGFARKYGKDACLTNEDAVKAQERYLEQFLNHRNPATGIAYKDDPDIIAFEISNEPHHHEAPEKVTAYIRRMISAMRKTGCEKPILYNVSHSIHLMDAYYDAGIQGGTFQWYPTGLGAQTELRGNFLPNVDRYVIPFADQPGFKKGAKVVYEFDAADVGRSYIYPAMARSFRQAGIQWATHFAYDPTYMAHANTEYNTHYMNLVYAPQKALSLKLAGEVFRQIPTYSDFGKYPQNMKFGPFRVSYQEDLAEMVTSERFIHTNNTSTNPPQPQKLKEVAGVGSSAIVRYEGTGAYFLDQIEKGVWRLEVLPDAIWVDNVFGRNRLDKEVAVVNWKTWPMTINLPDLGSGYSLQKLNGPGTTTLANGSTIQISPGSWLLVKKGTKTKITGNTKWKNIRLDEFTAPQTNFKKVYILHTAGTQLSEGEAYTVRTTIVSRDPAAAVEVIVMNNFQSQRYPMERKEAYVYEATLPADLISEGFLNYSIIVKEKGAQQAEKRDYQVPVIRKGSPLYLFTAAADHERLSRRWTRQSKVVPLAKPGDAEVRISVDKLYVPDPENREGEKIYDYSMRYFFGDQILWRGGGLQNKTNIVLKGRSLTGHGAIQIALVSADGVAFGKVIQLTNEMKEHSIPLAELTRVKLVTLPRPYPTFLSYWFDGPANATFDVGAVETLQISIGPGIPQDKIEGPQGIAIESIRLE